MTTAKRKKTTARSRRKMGRASLLRSSRWGNLCAGAAWVPHVQNPMNGDAVSVVTKVSLDAQASRTKRP